MTNSKTPATPSESKPHSLMRSVGIVLAIAMVAGALYWFFGSWLSLEALAEQETALLNFQAQQPALVFGIAFLIYVTVTGMSLPGAVPLSLAYGWFFGFFEAFVMISFASTLGATIAFLLSRYLFRDAIVNRFGEQLGKFNDSLEQEGAFYLFTLRLIPAVPFFVINAVMGLTTLKARTFWWVSQLGMLPGTAVLLYAASSVPEISTLADKGVYAAFSPTQMTQIFAAFVLLGVFPLAARWGLRWWKRSAATPAG